jgi:hypothetical protein
MPRAVALRHLIMQSDLRVGELARKRRLLCALVLVLASDLRKLGVDLDAALLGSFGGLRKLQELQLEVVASPLLRRNAMLSAWQRCCASSSSARQPIAPCARPSLSLASPILPRAHRAAFGAKARRGVAVRREE